jgi:ABC-type molybdate transport system ATPase subunit
MIAGLSLPERGVIQIGDNVVFDSAKKINLPPQKRNIGFMFQDYALFPNMTVEQNIRFGQHRVKEEAYIDQLIQTFGLETLRQTKPGRLSGGQKQRVAIGSAIASRKEIIIFDEPTSGLDLKHMKEVAYNIKKLQKKGIIIFIISHDLELILECCSHVLHFEKGKVVDNYVLDDAGEEKLKHFFINPIKDTNIPITSPVLLFPPKRC